MTTDDKLTATRVGELYGIKPATFRVYVHREQAPPADGHFDKRTPYWLRSTLERWRPEPNKAAPTAGSNEGESDDEESA